jgi:hypothetical protein
LDFVDIDSFALVVFGQGDSLWLFGLHLLSLLFAFLVFLSFLDVLVLDLLIVEVANVSSSASFLSGLITDVKK